MAKLPDPSRRARSGWRAIRPGQPLLTRSKDLRREANALKEVVAELTLENRVRKKSMIGDGGDDA
jgi:hypothetical protein